MKHLHARKTLTLLCNIAFSYDVTPVILVKQHDKYCYSTEQKGTIHSFRLKIYCASQATRIRENTVWECVEKQYGQKLWLLLMSSGTKGLIYLQILGKRRRHCHMFTWSNMGVWCLLPEQ